MSWARGPPGHSDWGKDTNIGETKDTLTQNAQKCGVLGVGHKKGWSNWGRGYLTIDLATWPFRAGIVLALTRPLTLILNLPSTMTEHLTMRLAETMPFRGRPGHGEGVADVLAAALPGLAAAAPEHPAHAIADWRGGEGGHILLPGGASRPKACQSL